MNTLSRVLIGLAIVLLLAIAISWYSPVVRARIHALVHPGAATVADGSGTSAGPAPSVPTPAPSIAPAATSTSAVASSDTPSASTGSVIVLTGAATPDRKGIVIATGMSTGAVTPSGSGAVDMSLPRVLLDHISAKIHPDAAPNTDVFGVIVDPSRYATYADAATHIRFFTFNPDSGVLLSGSGMTMVSTLFTLNKTNTFFDGTLYLNRIAKDDTIRMIVTIQGREIGIEAPSKQYDMLKHLLLTH